MNVPIPLYATTVVASCALIRSEAGYVHSSYVEEVELLDEEVDKTCLIRPFGQTEWIEPTVDIYERDCKGGKE